MKKLSLKLFLLLALLIILLNLIFSLFNDLQLLRIVRLITTVLFLLFFIYLKLHKSLMFTLTFLLLLLSDIGILYYENKWLCYLRFVAFIIIHILLSYHIFNRFYFKKIKPIVVVAFLVFFVSCIFLVVKLKSVIDFNVFGEIHEYLYYVYTITITALIFLSTIYSLVNNTIRSDIFFAMIVSFLISDILLMVGYYLDFFLILQIERFFQVMAMTMLLYYVVIYNTIDTNNTEDLL